MLVATGDMMPFEFIQYVIPQIFGQNGECGTGRGK